MHAEIPPPDDSGHEAVELFLRTLPVSDLPPAWRAAILNAPPPAPPADRFFTRKFVSLMTGIWSLAAALHFTTPPPPPLPEGEAPESSEPFYPAPVPPNGNGDPWLAQNHNHSRFP